MFVGDRGAPTTLDCGSTAASALQTSSARRGFGSRRLAAAVVSAIESVAHRSTPHCLRISSDLHLGHGAKHPVPAYPSTGSIEGPVDPQRFTYDVLAGDESPLIPEGSSGIHIWVG